MIQQKYLVNAGNDTRITKKISYSQLLRNRKFKLVEKPKDTKEYYLGQIDSGSGSGSGSSSGLMPTYIQQFTIETEIDPNYEPTFIQQYDKEIFVRGEPEPNNSRPIVLFHQYSAGQTWFR
tara:strand:+ start:382 stop:744 length:363 start_codon:yes stop_codon:yes gene_type:complete